MTGTSGGALLTLVVPLLALGAAGLGWWEVTTALRILALGVLAVLAVGVVALKLLAHG